MWRIRCGRLGLLVVTLGTSACMPLARFSTTELTYPICMNERTAIATPEFTTRTTGAYIGGAGQTVTASQYSSSHAVWNRAEHRASHALGGRDDQAITNLRFDIETYYFFLGAVHGEVEAQGTVVTLHPNTAAPR